MLGRHHVLRGVLLFLQRFHEKQEKFKEINEMRLNFALKESVDHYTQYYCGAQAGDGARL
jgi:hypothetical protein